MIYQCRRLIKVHQKNQGVSKTRQKALGMVSTDYVAFIDPDDYIEKDYLENIKMLEGIGGTKEVK